MSALVCRETSIVLNRLARFTVVFTPYHRDGFNRAFLTGFGPTNMHDETPAVLFQILCPQRHQLRTAKGAGKTEKE